MSTCKPWEAGCHYNKKERIGMVYRQIDKMNEAEREAIKTQAHHWQSRLNDI